MNDSSDDPERTQREPGEKVEYWDHRQNARVIGATGGNVMNSRSDELRQTYQGAAEAIVRREISAEAIAKE